MSRLPIVWCKCPACETARKAIVTRLRVSGKSLEELTYVDAERVALDRARRENVPVSVFQKGAVFYVRTEAEGKPEGATVLSVALPEGAVECASPETCGVCHRCQKPKSACGCEG